MSSRSAIDILQEMVPGRMELNASLSELTTMRTGGPADILIRPAGVMELGQILRFLAQRNIECFLLGNGSAVVVRDGGIRGAVLHLGEGFDSIERLPDEGGRPVFRAQAGVQLRDLVRWAVGEGIGGFEFLYGIPGTVGGALCRNAGAWGREIGETVASVETMSAEGDVTVSPADFMGFSYRRSKLPKGRVLLSAVFRGEPAEPELLRRAIQGNYERRLALHPVEAASAGMIFMNPEGRHAGELIEQCGLKGVRVGDAEISRQHANFIVNLGAATAGQIVSLVGMVQERVYVRHKIRLQPKVEFVGSWQREKLRIQE